MDTIILDPGNVTLGQLRAIWEGHATLVSANETAARVKDSADIVAKIVQTEETVYGIDTGFGLLASTQIPEDQLAQLQTNLVLSHSTGTGAYLSDNVVRLVLATKALSLSQGLSGVRPMIIDRLLSFYAKGASPCIPEKGSVGASGDLAPLAHMAASMMGYGRMRINGEEMPAADGLKKMDIDPLELGPKEGLALLNGTQVSNALALDALFRAENAFAAALVTGALSVDALRGSTAPFDARIHAARRQPGQMAVAAKLLELLKGSEVLASHENCGTVQDPYSFRCQPQVMGAILDVLCNAAATLEAEANAVTDNPLIFADTGEAISGGNFHAEPVAFAADMISMAACEIASISERRLAVLVDPKMSGLPAFLVEASGLNSGFMIAQVTAAALVSENKTLAHPASVDSIPTSANQEDHVSMATFAGRKAGEIADNVAVVVGIEYLAAVQGIDLVGLKTSPVLISYVDQLRQKVLTYQRDRYFADDIEAAKQFVVSGAFLDAGKGLLPSLK